MIDDVLKILTPFVIGIIGAVVGHYFTNRSNRLQKRRNISIEHLVKAYRILADEISHRKNSKENSRKLESIISDIQLFGSIEQVELAKELIDNIKTGNSFDLDPLLNSLRNDLRKQLKLESIDGNVRWLRFNDEE